MAIKQWYFAIRNALGLIIYLFLMCLGYFVCCVIGHKYQDINHGKFRRFKECKRCGKMEKIK